MKNTDIAMVIFVAAISVALSYFLGNAFFGDPNDSVEELSYMNTISSDIEEPDAETFNPTAKNPTVEVYIGKCGAMETWNSVERRCKPNSEEESTDTVKNDDVDTDTSDDDTDDTDTDAGTDTGDE